MSHAGTKLIYRSNPDVAVVSAISPSAVSLRRPHGTRPLLFLVTDLCGFWAVSLLVIALRFHWAIGSRHLPPAMAPHLGFALLYATFIGLLNHVYGLYSPYQALAWRHEFLSIAKSVSLATLLIVATVYSAGSREISRFVIGSIGVLSVVVMAGWRKARRISISRATADGVTCHNVLIVGTDSLAQSLREHLAKERQLGFVVSGLLATEPAWAEAHGDIPYCIGGLDDLPRLCRTHFVDEIILCAQPRHVVKSVIERAKEFGVGVRLVPDLYEAMVRGAHLDYLGVFPSLNVVRRDVRAFELRLKRLLDITVSASALIILSPIMLAMAILIRLDSKGPTFYASKRVGKKGRVFSCYKFRTMVTDAEALKVKLQHLNERDGVLFKIQNDPRITRVGRFLRKYSLDELAQLWNVLKGDMSLVGPRPPLASEVKQYELEHYRRLEAAPGITGMWQVEARTSPSFQEYISLDLRYVANWSFGLDLKILFKTVAVVFAGTGS